MTTDDQPTSNVRELPTTNRPKPPVDEFPDELPPHRRSGGSRYEDVTLVLSRVQALADNLNDRLIQTEHATDVHMLLLELEDLRIALLKLGP
jgi:hypothetical protein